MILAVETLAVAGLFVAFLCLWPRQAPAWRRARRAARRLARHRVAVVLGTGLLASLGSMGLSVWAGPPQPSVHDEFSHLLLADTFAHGRVANPAHPLWRHFESMHTIQCPTYTSKFPPAHGLVLAAGQRLAGHPVVGVWLEIGLACAAVSWMLQGWLPPPWAALGALLTVARLALLSRMDWGDRVLPYWSHSYWSGALAAAGGALVFGAVVRLLHLPRARHGWFLGAGLAVLMNTRPFEGMLAALPVAGLLLWRWPGGEKGRWQGLVGCVLVPVLAVTAATVAAMTWYNARTTGDPLRAPYQVYQETYDAAPKFLWQSPGPEPQYGNAAMRQFHAVWELGCYRKQQSAGGLLRGMAAKLTGLWHFYLDAALAVPLLALPWMLRDRRVRLVLVCGVFFLAGLLQEVWAFPHYTAPVAPLVFLLVVQAVRHLRLWRRRAHPLGRCLAGAVCLACLLSLIVATLVRSPGDPGTPAQERARILAKLKKDGRRHLVIVRYGRAHIPHDEWVYNDADIDAAPVVWARDLGRGKNAALLNYFKGRWVWLLEADKLPPRLVPFRR